ncbi:PREDICTED: uncharacterized protein LOC109218034 [Nicotiana attenuata]|uniref:uncharacterized protein LOC109218034 n=1 Tax=Nicotiana attenuata TaxID=49451 RepID=UPI00090594DB|nr:PREDICTED: uncharacterized protein LOC109218034 [Nicotiana attenuata]
MTDKLQGADLFTMSELKAIAETSEQQISSPLTEGPIAVETTDRCRRKKRQDFKIKRILVDPGSSANIKQWRVLEQTKLIESIIPATNLLAGFNLASATTRGEILLLTNAQEEMKTTLFEVVDGDMGYNIILGRPWLHEMRVVPSTYHPYLKFSTPEGIKQIRGDQPTRREMNAISVSSSKGKERVA